MSKMKDIAKEVAATFTVAALTVAMVSTKSVFALGDGDDGGSSGGAGAGAAGENAQAGLSNVNPGASNDLNGMIQIIINTVFGIIGVVAVIMIIIGGVNYTMSQGDSTKVQKAKNTILYGPQIRSRNNRSFRLGSSVGGGRIWYHYRI